MKSNKTKLFLLAGWVLALLTAAAEIFFILNRTDAVNIKISVTASNLLVALPFGLIFVYALISAFYKTDIKQTLVISGIGVLVHINMLLFIIPPIGFCTCGCMAFTGIIMYLYSFSCKEKWTPLGIMLMDCACFEMAAFELANSWGKFSLWATLLLPVLFAFIIADLIAMAGVLKKDEEKKA